MSFLVNFILSIPKSLAAGFVLSKLWVWFVVPVFGLPAFSYMQAVGLMQVVSFAQVNLVAAIIRIMPEKEKKDKDISSEIAMALVWLLFLYPLGLAVGYAWHRAIMAWS